MATENTQRTISRLEERNRVNTSQINVIEGEIPKLRSKIDDYSPSLQKLDKDCLPTITQINNLKLQIVSIGGTAQLIVGCASTTGVTTIQSDNLMANTWNLSNEGYTGNDPFGGITPVVITDSNAGIGSVTYLRQSGGGIIGTYYSLDGPGLINEDEFGFPINPTPADNAACASCKNAISNLESQIAELRSSLNTPISTVNSIKAQRNDDHLLMFGLYKGKSNRQASIQSSQEAIDILTDPTLDSQI